MFRINIKGEWRRALKLLSNYDLRLAYAMNLFTKDVAEFFIKELVDRIPAGTEYDNYKKSLSVVRVGRSGTVHAVVSDRDRVKLSDINEDDDRFGIVISIIPTGNGTPVNNDIASLLSQNPFWTKRQLPKKFPRSSAMLVHRRVLKKEEVFAREETNAFIKNNMDKIKNMEIKIDKTDASDDVMTTSSLPDFMTLALRAEFGINEVPKPHWRPSISVLRRSLKSIIKNSKELNGVLYDPSYNKHMKGNIDSEVWGINRYKKESEEFEKAIGGK